MANTRNTNVETLRFILMLYVCFWHVIMHGFNFKNIGITDTPDRQGLGGVIFFLVIFSPAVYCFMFISGWYGIKFSLKKYLNYSFIAFSCFILSLAVRHALGESVRPMYIITNLSPIACNRWWFLTNYIMVYLIAPFVNAGFKMFDKDLIKQIFFIMTFIEVVSFASLRPDSGSSFWGLLYMYVLGRYIKSNDITFKRSHLFGGYLISLLLLWFFAYYVSTLPGRYSHYSYILLGYNNPLIIAMAVSIFLLVKDLKPTYSPKTNRILSNVLVIYLLTEGVGHVLYEYQAHVLQIHFVIGTLVVILTALVCTIIGEFLSNIFGICLKAFCKCKSFQML